MPIMLMLSLIFQYKGASLCLSCSGEKIIGFQKQWLSNSCKLDSLTHYAKSICLLIYRLAGLLWMFVACTTQHMVMAAALLCLFI